MKKLFDRHQERLSDSEDRRVWGAMFDATKRRKQPFWKNWRVLSTVGTLATAGLAVVVVLNSSQTPVRTELDALEGSGSEITVVDNISMGRDLVAQVPEAEKQEPLKEQEARRNRLPAAGRVDEVASAPTEESIAGARASLEKIHPPPGSQVMTPHIAADELAAEGKVVEEKEADLADAPAKDDERAAGLAGGAVAAKLDADGKAKVRVEPQGGVIRGRVTTDAGQPLRFANVELDGTAIGALSDSSGYFIIHDVPAGSYTANASYLGYATANVGISVEPGSDLDLACKLSEESNLRAQITDIGGADAVISGRVTTENGEPLSFANVVILGTELGGMTKKDGSFRITDVPPGSYTLKVSYLGYETEELNANLVGGKEFAQNFKLSEPVVASMDVIRVEGNREMIRRTESSTAHQVGDEELEQLPVDTFDEVVGLKSGVVSQGGQLHFRGGRAGESQSQIDGVPVNDPISVGGTDPVNGTTFDAMFFEHYGVNPFVDAEIDRLATFAVDVDNASYSVTQSFLNRGVLPPKDAIRVEEFINSFDHDYAPPRDEFVANREWAPSEHGTFAIHLDAAPSPFGKDMVLMRVGLKGREVHARDRKPATLTFVVDVSGSMNRENRLGLVKRALFMLLDQMNHEDEVALVVYGSDARVICPPTPLRDRTEIEDAINRLQAGGSTYAEAGLRAGYEIAEKYFRPGRINRVVLCSDGVANVGRTGAEDILRIIKSQTGKGIYLTAVGFGMGNYNDVLMEKLANQGDGNYYYVDGLDEAHKVFVENLTGTLQTIARDMKIQVEFEPGTVKRYRLLGYENRDVADRDFRNDKVDAGEVGAGHEVTALFEMRLDGRSRRQEMATVRIRYEDPETGRVTEEKRTIRVEDVAGRFKNADPTFRMDAAVAEFAEILRHSYWAKDGSLSEALGVARDASRELGRPEELEEMVRLAETAWRLWPNVEKPQWNGDIRPQWEPDDDERR